MRHTVSSGIYISVMERLDVEALLADSGWLRSLCRNLIRDKHLAEDVSSADRSDSILKRAEFRRSLLDAVMTLDEPYRSTVVLRYFEDMNVYQVARALGEPAVTVRIRLLYSLERVRRRLEDEFRSEWTIWASSLGWR